MINSDYFRKSDYLSIYKIDKLVEAYLHYKGIFPLKKAISKGNLSF